MAINKFLKKGKTPCDRKPHLAARPYRREEELLRDCAACWHSLSTVREKADRSFQYAWGNQWGDIVQDPDRQSSITEEELIRRQGNQPLKNNMIAPILNNIEGQFKNNIPRTVISSRNQTNSKAGEMMTVAVEYVQDNNATDTIDTEAFVQSLCSGIKMQRIEYGWHDDKRAADVWLYNVDYNRCFFNTDLRDARAWDLRIVGEIMDATLDELKARFVNAAPVRERSKIEAYLNDIYGGDLSRNESTDFRSMRDENNTLSFDFYSPQRTDLCRVIFVWRKEYRRALFVHDTLRATTDFVDDTHYWRTDFDQQNQARIAEATAAGLDPEEAMLIEYEPRTEVYWQYYYLSPYGDILETGRSPFWHHSHNYALSLYPLRNGNLYNYVEQFIDQQRIINRTLMQIDFIRGSSARGLLVVDKNAFEAMQEQEIISEYSRYNGVLFARLKPGMKVSDALQQFNTSAVAAGDFELLQLQLKLINDISGISTALQGQEAKAGVSAKMYLAQSQNSSINLQGVMSNFREWRRERDYKLMMTVQQYYNERKYIDIAGRDYEEEAKWYDPDKVQNAKLYLRIADSGSSPAYSDLQNEFLMQLYQQQGIDIMTMLENSNYPWAPRLIETLKRRQEEAQQQAAMQQAAQTGEQQALQGIPPEQMQQVQQSAQNPRLAALMNDDTLSAPGDGVTRTA